jgi:hypothetical protein
MDNLVFEESVNSEISSSEFISKKWVYVNDSNAQNYTSQVVVDSTPLSNAGGWLNWQEAYMLMPLVVEMTAPAGITEKQVAHSWAFKAGFWHMISSMTVEFNNQNVVQQTPFLNVFRSFKAHTSFSQDDLYNEGSSIGYYPDTAGSWSWCPTVIPVGQPNAGNPTPATSPLTQNGFGLCNNRSSPSLVSYSPVAGASIATTTPIYMGTSYAGQSSGTVSTGDFNPSYFPGDESAFNAGFAKRSSWYGYTNAGSALNQTAINPITTSNTVYRSSTLPQAGANNFGWQIYAKLRLKDLSDFFEKCPLLKGATIRFLINTNQTTINFNITAGSANATTGVIDNYRQLTVTNVSVLGGLSNPLMIASPALGQGAGSLPAGDGYTLSASIFKSPDGLYKTGLQSCRLYAPVYKMNPLSEQRYLQLAPTKRVAYRDIFQYSFPGIGGNGTSFNILVNNGISNIKSVLIVPFISTSAAGSPAYSSLLSPTSTSGATPDPIVLTNVNIQLSGVNLFLNNEYYDFEQFMQELKSSNQLNGSLTTGLASGLINEDMFSRGYRYYYGNASRVLPSEEGVSRSVQILGQNMSTVPCDLMVFVEYEKHVVLDISTGARIE